MKEKLLAIMNANPDSDLLALCFKFYFWMAHRDGYMIEEIGLEDFIQDDCKIPKEELWRRFKYYLNSEK